jgi:hypothetical protein
MASGRRRRGTVAAITLASLLGAMGGCEIAIGNDIPEFECVQGHGVCPGKEVCDPSSSRCVAPCSPSGCARGLECQLTQNICVAGDAGAGTEASTSDGAAHDNDGSDETPEEAEPPDDSGTAG